MFFLKVCSNVINSFVGWIDELKLLGVYHSLFNRGKHTSRRITPNSQTVWFRCIEAVGNNNWRIKSSGILHARNCSLHGARSYHIRGSYIYGRYLVRYMFQNIQIIITIRALFHSFCNLSLWFNFDFIICYGKLLEIENKYFEWVLLNLT